LGTIFLIAGHGQRRLRVGGFAIAVVLATLVILQFLPTGRTAYDRLIGRVAELSVSGESVGLEVDPVRRYLWGLGLRLFRENPISGVGLRKFQAESVAEASFRSVGDPHSAYVQVLAETGLLGMVPFVVLLGHVGWVLLRNRKTLPRHLTVWKAVFAGAFFGMLVYSIFGTSQYARFFWIPVAFAALLELEERRSAQQDTAVTARGVPSAQSE
jgi:O-antigen ligase